MVLQKIIFLLARRVMTERMVEGRCGFWGRRLYADYLKRYSFAAKFAKDKNVLDIACGDGFGTYLLSKKAKSVVGTDIDSNTVNLAKAKYGSNNKNLSYAASDAVKFLSENKDKFDVIVSFETIEHLSEYKKFCELAYKALKKEGLFIVSTPNKELSVFFAGETFNPYHIHEFYPEELNQMLEKIFRSKPKIFLQRPLMKKRVLISFIRQFFFREDSEIVPDQPDLSGIDILVQVGKK